MTADQIQFKQELGRLIRAMREQRGMTLKYVADLIGITFQQMQKYENGDDAISLYRLQQISHIFEVSFSSFMDTDFTKSDYRILDRDQIRKYFLDVKNLLNDFQTELMRK